MKQAYEQLVGAQEVAALLGVSTATVRCWARTAGLPYLKLGARTNGLLRFEPAAVEAWAGMHDQGAGVAPRS